MTGQGEPRPVVYANLTSGLEGAPLGCRFVRIQSSHFEAGAYWAAIADLDYQFLIDAALRGVVLHDCGSRRGEASRAQWQAVPWIVWAYDRAALRCQRDHPVDDAFVGGVNVSRLFADKFHASARARDIGIAKLRYVHKLTGRPLVIANSSRASTLDGDYVALSGILRAHYDPRREGLAA